MSPMTSRFIIAANIAHFKERLAKESDPETIAMLRKLLIEEESKLAEYRLVPPASRGTK